MPPGCAVAQAAYIVRHGAYVNVFYTNRPTRSSFSFITRRYPEPGGSFDGWESLFAKFQNSSYTASGPLAFIPSWTPAVDVPNNEPLFLTTTGAREAFNLGVDLRQRYGFTPGGENFTVWYALSIHINFCRPDIFQGLLLNNALSTRVSTFS